MKNWYGCIGFVSLLGVWGLIGSEPLFQKLERGLMQKMIKNRIKEYRARFDMKQEDLANLVGVRRETIGNLEKGKYNPSLVLAWNIAKVFHVSIEEIFTVEEQESQTSQNLFPCLTIIVTNRLSLSQ